MQISPRYSRPKIARPSQFWLACFVLAAAVLVSAIIDNGFIFDFGVPYAGLKDRPRFGGAQNYRR
jgi:hypothetical protein